VTLSVLASPTPTPNKSAPPHKKPPAKKVNESNKPPFIGMTKAEALARYGKPKQKTSTEEGEQWSYWLNFGEYLGKHMTRSSLAPRRCASVSSRSATTGA